LNSKRVIEVIDGHKLVIKTKVEGRKSQLFKFDVKSRTIKTVAHKGKSIDMQDKEECCEDSGSLDHI